MRRTFAGLVPFISILAIFCACSGGAAARTSLADPARTSVTLEVWPEQGLFGFVGSTHKCGTARKVVVSRKIGDDWRRIGIARSLHRPSARPGTYQWRLETKKTTGRLRVKVASSARCRGAARAGHRPGGPHRTQPRHRRPDHRGPQDEQDQAGEVHRPTGSG